MNVDERTIRESLARASERARFLPLLLCRVTLGWEFLVSGWSKVHSEGDVIGYFQKLGIGHPAFSATLVSWTELVCGALLLLGLLTRLSCVPLLVTMTVALVVAKHGDVHGLSDLFYQAEFGYICMLVVVFVLGPGGVSVDGIVAASVDRSHPARPRSRQPGRPSPVAG